LERVVSRILLPLQGAMII